MASIRCALGWHLFTDWRSSGRCEEMASCDRDGCGEVSTRPNHDFSGPGTPGRSGMANVMTYYCAKGCGEYYSESTDTSWYG